MPVKKKKIHGSGGGGGGGGGDKCVCGGGGVGMGTSMGYARHARRKIVIYRSGFDSTLVIWPLKDTKTDS